MRVDLKKFLFVGPNKEKERFFKEAQKAGIIEFIDPRKVKRLQVSKEADEYLQAIKILRGHVQAPQEMKKNLELAKIVCSQILHAKQTIDETEELLRKALQELARISPFGDFSLNEVTELEKETNRKVRFYCAKSSKHFEKHSSELLLINSQDGLDYFIAITQDAITHSDLLEVPIGETLSVLKKKEANFLATIQEKQELLNGLTRYNWLMHYAFVDELNKVSYDTANATVTPMVNDTVFVVTGWVPDNKREALAALTSSLDIVAEEVTIDPSDSIPTCLDNKGIPRVGEDIIHIFDTPSHTDKDPSVWVLSCFALFFAMIVGDAGYGLIFLLTAFFIRYKIKNLKGLGKRFVELIMILGIVCVGWGLLMNNFFSINFSSENPLKKYSLINWLVEKKTEYHMEMKDETYTFWVSKIPALKDAKTPEEFISIGNKAAVIEHPAEKFTSIILLEMAIFIGSVHIVFGLLRYLKKNPVGAGWVAFIIGGYLYLPKFLDATSLIHFAFGIDPSKGAEFGLHLLSGGLVFAIVAAIYRGGILGIFEIMTSIQLLADILSYLRIYALGLAGSIVSATINDISSKLPLFVAIILIIGGHTLNIALSIMGGVIHGLRLNFLEWYHYSFEGGGKKFRPLELHIFD